MQILRPLHESPAFVQRELCERVGVRLGAVNYFLKALIERGLLKASNFSNGSNKLGYAQVLMSSGIAEKTMSKGRFLAAKRGEYQALTAEVETLSLDVSVQTVDGMSREENP